MPEQNNNSECAGDTTIKKWLYVENQGPEWHSLSQLFYNTNFKNCLTNLYDPQANVLIFMNC